VGFFRWFFLGFFGWVFLGGFFNANPGRNRVVVPARQLHRLAEWIPWNRFLGP
jgi:hypothetical protein